MGEDESLWQLLEKDEEGRTWIMVICGYKEFVHWDRQKVADFLHHRRRTRHHLMMQLVSESQLNKEGEEIIQKVNQHNSHVLLIIGCRFTVEALLKWKTAHLGDTSRLNVNLCSLHLLSLDLFCIYIMSVWQLFPQVQKLFCDFF